MCKIQNIQVKSILSKTNLPVGDFAVNPYVGCTHACKYCYATFMKKFTNHTEDWGTFLDVKFWNEIKNPQRYFGKEIFLSSVTDPYNPQEKIYQRTKTFLEQMLGSGAKITIQTKSDLILRDLELIKKFPDVRVGFSINTLDENFKNAMDNAPPIERRIFAMKTLHDAGIRTTCFISPIFPQITDVEAIIDRVKDFCNLVWLENLNLRGNFKPTILNYIAKNYPQHLELYKKIYLRGDKTFWENLDAQIKTFTDKNNLVYVRNDDTVQNPFDAPPVIVNYFYHEQLRRN